MLSRLDQCLALAGKKPDAKGNGSAENKIAHEAYVKRVTELREFFGTFHYTHKRSGRKVSADVFPFHNWAFQEGLLHAENIGGDIELVLGQRCLIGAFPWRYDGLEACPCRIVAFLDTGEMSVEAIGEAAKAVARS